MLLTSDKLHELIPNATDKNIIKFASSINATLVKYNINTPLRIAAFIAQIAHESGSLHYIEEIASGKAYEYREDLGNLESEAIRIAHANKSTTGRFYKGRGLLQVTGYYNYVACGKALNIDCVNNPKLLCEPMYAVLAAGWFWDLHHCNSLADIGSFTAITKVINGGYNGLAERKAIYTNCKDVLNCS